MHNFSVNEPGTYPHAVEMFDAMSTETKQRLVRDSRGVFHTLHQSIYVLGSFDQLTGLASYTEGAPFRPDFDKSREIMDEAVAQAERSGLPLDTCFQMVVLKRDHEALSEIVRREEEAEEKARKDKE